jgi:hypothetical protein
MGAFSPVGHRIVGSFLDDELKEKIVTHPIIFAGITEERHENSKSV